MTEGDFRVKYERIDVLKAQMKAREAELASLSPEERSAFIAQVTLINRYCIHLDIHLDHFFYRWALGLCIVGLLSFKVERYP